MTRRLAVQRGPAIRSAGRHGASRASEHQCPARTIGGSSHPSSAWSGMQPALRVLAPPVRRRGSQWIVTALMLGSRINASPSRGPPSTRPINPSAFPRQCRSDRDVSAAQVPASTDAIAESPAGTILPRTSRLFHGVIACDNAYGTCREVTIGRDAAQRAWRAAQWRRACRGSCSSLRPKRIGLAHLSPSAQRSLASTLGWRPHAHEIDTLARARCASR